MHYQIPVTFSKASVSCLARLDLIQFRLNFIFIYLFIYCKLFITESKFAEDNRSQNGVRLLEMEGKLEKSACFNASHYLFLDLSDQDRACLNSNKVFLLYAI